MLSEFCKHAMSCRFIYCPTTIFHNDTAKALRTLICAKKCEIQIAKLVPGANPQLQTRIGWRARWRARCASSAGFSPASRTTRTARSTWKPPGRNGEWCIFLIGNRDECFWWRRAVHYTHCEGGVAHMNKGLFSIICRTSVREYAHFPIFCEHRLTGI